jgi:hypothetical protein
LKEMPSDAMEKILCPSHFIPLLKPTDSLPLSIWAHDGGEVITHHQSQNSTLMLKDGAVFSMFQA